MTVILDAGALVAVERGDRAVVAMLKGERRAGRVPATHGGVVGQVWRGGARQACSHGCLTPWTSLPWTTHAAVGLESSWVAAEMATSSTRRWSCSPRMVT